MGHRVLVNVEWSGGVSRERGLPSHATHMPHDCLEEVDWLWVPWQEPHLSALPQPFPPFPSVPPQGQGAVYPSPESFLFPRPGPSRTLTARGQSATFQWLHTPTGRAGIPAWGVGVGQGGRQGENCSAEADSATVPITLRPRSRGGKGNRSPTAPSRVGKKKPLNLPGLARGRSSRNCKMQSENIRSWASVP